LSRALEYRTLAASTENEELADEASTAAQFRWCQWATEQTGDDNQKRRDAL